MVIVMTKYFRTDIDNKDLININIHVKFQSELIASSKVYTFNNNSKPVTISREETKWRTSKTKLVDSSEKSTSRGWYEINTSKFRLKLEMFLLNYLLINLKYTKRGYKV